MLETWLSKERLLSNSTPRFLADDEESREQPSSVRQCSRLLLVWFLSLIINTSVFSEFSTVYGIKHSKLFFFWLNKCLEACVYSNFINQKQSSKCNH